MVLCILILIRKAILFALDILVDKVMLDILVTMVIFVLYYISEIIAAFASVFVGFRVVAVFGSICVGAGFLGAAFVKPSDEIELMGFLVGFLGGKVKLKERFYSLYSYIPS